jgi:hypothetical protein
MLFLLAAQMLPPIVATPGPALLAQQRAEAERLKQEKIAEGYRLDWIDCIQRKKLVLRASTEPVRDVATAVMSACRNEEIRYQGAIPMRFDYAEQITSRARSTLMDALVGFFVEDRLNRRARKR